MDNTFNLNESTVLKEKKRYLIMSVVTLVLSLVGAPLSLSGYFDFYRLLSSLLGNAEQYLGNMGFVMILDVILTLIQPLSAVLLLVCAAKSRPTPKKSLICITFASVILSPLVGLIMNIANITGISALFTVFLSLALVISFAFATADAAKNFKKTLSLKIAGSIFLLKELIVISDTFILLQGYGATQNYLSLCGKLLSIAGDVMFIITLFSLAFFQKRTLAASATLA